MADAGQANSRVDMPDWPLFGWADDVRPALLQMRDGGGSGVLATLYNVIGGAPRPVGSQMLIAEGEMHGFLSGGCIEGDIAAHAAEVLESGRPQRLVYGDGGPFADIRLVCGGRVDILLERVSSSSAALARLLDAYVNRRLALWASDGVDQACILEGESVPANLQASLSAGFSALAAEPQALLVSVSAGEAVARRYAPQARLIVVGHDPTALAIASLASQSGFETHLIRPKGPPTPPPLPNVGYHRQDVVQALSAIGLDAWTYVAVATHELEADHAALRAALPSPAAYVGVLGAQRRLPERLARLRDAGLPTDVTARLHAPIGLDLGGKAPFEIAVAVLAEVMAEANRLRPNRILERDGRTSQAA